MIRPTTRLSSALLAALVTLPAAAADVSIYLSDQSDLTGSPSFSNAAVTKGTSESGSLFVYVDTSVALLGVPLDIRSTTPGIIEFTGINIFSPYLDPTDGFADTDNFDLATHLGGGGEVDDAPEVRWASTSSDPVTPDAIDRALAFGFGSLIGLGLDPGLAGGLTDPRTSGSGDYAFAEITYNTLAEGSTDIFVSITDQDDLALTPFGGAAASSVSLDLGAGEATELTGITGAGKPLGDGTAVTGNLIPDAVITVSDATLVIGDYNTDGFVSQADLDLVLLNWGDAVAPGGFDENAVPGGGPFDGLMSQNELDGVLLNWGDGTPPVVAVPEPTSLALMGLSGLALSRRRR